MAVGDGVAHTRSLASAVAPAAAHAHAHTHARPPPLCLADVSAVKKNPKRRAGRTTSKAVVGDGAPSDIPTSPREPFFALHPPPLPLPLDPARPTKRHSRPLSRLPPRFFFLPSTRVSLLFTFWLPRAPPPPLHPVLHTAFAVPVLVRSRLRSLFFLFALLVRWTIAAASVSCFCRSSRRFALSHKLSLFLTHTRAPLSTEAHPGTRTHGRTSPPL